MRALRAGAVTLLAVLVLTLAGCVSVPTAGRVEQVEGAQQACQNCVAVEVAPPSAGDEPLQIVEGFLRANAYYQPNYSVARQFLTPAAAQKWSPEDGVSVYRGTPTGSGTGVTMDYHLVGSVRSDRSYQVEDRDLAVDFGLVQVDGQWRIGSPPAGLMVAAYVFPDFYSSYDLFFVGNDGVLVPDPIYLPKLRNPANIASALVKALLNGPTRWLKTPAVSTALPLGTTLSVDSVTINDGIATVPLSDSVLNLPDTQRSLLAAQIIYTLKDAVTLRGLLITVNQQSFRVPEGDPTTSVISVDAISADHEPVSTVAADQLYVVSGGAVQRVDRATNDLNRFPGDLGSGRLDVDSVAVSVTDTDLAAVVGGGSAVVRATTTGDSGQVTNVLSGLSGVLRPQFDRFGALWVLGRQAGVQKLWRVTPDGKSTEVSAPALRGREIVAFKISPDGTRVGLVARTTTGQQLGVAWISRADTVSVDGWRAIDTAQSSLPTITQLRDVGWLDATNLVVVGSATLKDVPSIYSVQQDGSDILSEGESGLDWNPVSVTVLLRTQSAVVRSANNQSWRDEGNTWSRLVPDVTAVAYPG